MDFNTPCMVTPENIDYISNRIKDTVFPIKEFSDENEREIFALEEHSSWDETSFNELILKISIDYLENYYCWWCRCNSGDEYINNKGDVKTKKLIVEHLHIKGDAGKYRGVLCTRCNYFSKEIKDILKHSEKVDYLFKKIGSTVYKDRKWCDDQICIWYGCSIDVL